MYQDEQTTIDRESLRQYTKSQLAKIFEQTSRLINSDETRAFWQGLHNIIAAKQKPEQDDLINIESQLTHLPIFVSTWISSAVDTPERLEFFILAKADEIASGDQQKDYFWAMQIRHDQLVALVRVLTKLVELMSKWVKSDPKIIVGDAFFLGLSESSIEDQIYLEAESIHKKRQQRLQS